MPPSVLGDGAGALGMAFGIACALVDARATGRGRVVDAAIVDIVAMLGTLVHWIRANGQIDGAQPSPFHDSPFYDVYVCADGGFISLGAIEPPFYALLLSVGPGGREPCRPVRHGGVASVEGAHRGPHPHPAPGALVRAA